MNEQQLSRLAILSTLLGLGLLFLFAGEPNLSRLEQTQTFTQDQEVQMQGTITKLTAKENLFFLQITGQKTETMDVVFFPKEAVNLQEGNYVEITGMQEEYNGKQEVLADSVIVK